MGSAHGNGDPLGVDREAMRALGYRTVDMLVDRLADRDIPPLRRATPVEMRRRLSEPPPDAPQDYEAILRRLERDVLPFMSRGDHPGFLAFVPFCGTWPSALGDFIASACNVYAGSWMESAGPTQLELEVLGWFKRWIGYPEQAGGVLVGGGSAANLTALACARESVVGAMSQDIVGYVADQAHSSLGRAARVLGFRPDQLRVLPVDGDFRLDPRTLAAAMEADLQSGRRPLFVAASAGATNTGAIDPLPELARLCRERGVWFHVDAAYGGFAVMTDRGRAWLRGIEQADSITLDPHKWLYQPWECGCLLVREDQKLRSAFQMTPDYLQDAVVEGEEVNLCDRGVQLSRGARAIKVWVSLQYFGVAAFRAAIDRSLDLAAEVAGRVRDSDALELMAPPSLGVICFRRRFPEASDDAEVDRLNAGLVAALEDSGLGLVSSTQLRGRYAIRPCVLNHTTGREDLERVMDFLEQAEPAPRPVGARDVYERDPPMRTTPLRRRIPDQDHSGVGPEIVAGLSLFATLGEDERARIAALARLSTAPAGAAIVDQWDVSLDFFVIVEGRVEVLVDDAVVAELGAGDFFGELGALDWGAGFGYPRLASVRALAPTVLLIFPAGSMNLLAREHPVVAGQIRRTGVERLTRNRP
ncbi:MAG: aminotransferase class V-fold PLP-dependent enzyme [Actinomycetota bacterium]|nr:aminotransferase class V-fold PLP-dependent enzyme [Actinomycetota bacterium]